MAMAMAMARENGIYKLVGMAGICILSDPHIKTALFSKDSFNWSKLMHDMATSVECGYRKAGHRRV